MGTATDTGVKTPKTEEIERQPSPADLMREEIAARAAKERDEEIERTGGEVIDTSVVEEKAVEKAPEEKAVEKAPEEKVEGVEKMVKIKVEGVEKEVPESSIIDAGVRALQKESAADQRLEEATRLFREAQALVTPKQEVEPPPKELGGAEIAQAIRLGNDEEALAAIEALRTKPVMNQPSPEAIANFVEQRVEGKRAFEGFMATYPDIAKNEDLMHLALQKDEKLIAGGDKRSYSERYDDIGKSIYALIGKTVQTGKEVSEVVTSAEKLAKKATITNLKSASVKPGATGEEKPKSASDIINEMRKQRGQA